ncbi:hypothetical protein TcWFU_008276 [Taenia crassiceps]|uniref:Uncharacterized protein n=1 Tax=Taenia crassiceps TaxID=6207 RepID=A0ABR4QII9_9CEST
MLSCSLSPRLPEQYVNTRGRRHSRRRHWNTSALTTSKRVPPGYPSRRNLVSVSKLIHAQMTSPTRVSVRREKVQLPLATIGGIIKKIISALPTALNPWTTERSTSLMKPLDFSRAAVTGWARHPPANGKDKPNWDPGTAQKLPLITHYTRTYITLEPVARLATMSSTTPPYVAQDYPLKPPRAAAAPTNHQS